MSALRDALQDLSEDVFFDLLESDDAYLLVLDVPGVSATSLDVSVEDGRLSIDAQREKDLPGDYQYLEENRSLFFDVNLPLPDDALPDEAEAAVERGVLELTLPKRPGSGETTIDVVEGHADGDGDSDSATDDTGTDSADSDGGRDDAGDGTDADEGVSADDERSADTTASTPGSGSGTDTDAETDTGTDTKPETDTKPDTDTDTDTETRASTSTTVDIDIDTDDHTTTDTDAEPR